MTDKTIDVLLGQGDLSIGKPFKVYGTSWMHPATVAEDPLTSQLFVVLRVPASGRYAEVPRISFYHNAVGGKYMGKCPRVGLPLYKMVDTLGTPVVRGFGNTINIEDHGDRAVQYDAFDRSLLEAGIQEPLNLPEILRTHENFGASCGFFPGFPGRVRYAVFQEMGREDTAYPLLFGGKSPDIEVVAIETNNDCEILYVGKESSYIADMLSEAKELGLVDIRLQMQELGDIVFPVIFMQPTNAANTREGIVMDLKEINAIHYISGMDGRSRRY